MIEGTGEKGFKNGVTFEHALTHVTIKAYAENNSAKTKWEGINSITILNKKQKCILKLPDVSESHNGVGDKPPISFSDGMGDIMVEGEAIDIKVADFDEAATYGYAMFAPTQDAEELTIVVTTKKGGPLQTKVSRTFEAGKKYEITHEFSTVE
jgi:hypothetical protein